MKTLKILNLASLLPFAMIFANPASNATEGNVLSLDGVNDYATATTTIFPNSTALQSFTVEAWIYPTKTSTEWIAADDCYDLKFFYTSGAGNGGLGIQFVLYRPGGSQNMVEYRDVQLNQWNHVAGIYDAVSSQMKLAINGVLSPSPSTYTGGSFLSDPGFNFFVGQSGFSGGYFKSYIDEIRVSATVRYTANFSPANSFATDGDTRGLWRFNETAGSTIFADASGAGNSVSGSNGAQTINLGGDPRPTVTSIIRLNPSFQTNNAQFVTWLVDFSEPVVGVDLTDFTLTDMSGTVIGELLGNVSTGGGTQVQVTANTGAGGVGDLRLDVNYPGATLTDLSGNRLTNSFTAGQIYTIDKIAPTVVSIDRLNPPDQITSATSVAYRVTFSKYVNGTAGDDFTLIDATGTITGESIASVSATSGTAIDVAVNTGSGDGVLRLDILAGAASIFDNAGNSLRTSFTNGQSFTLQRSVGARCGTFTSSGQDLGSSLTQSVALGDLDGDGDLDAVFGHGGFGNSGGPTKVWFNDGVGHFTDSGQTLNNSTIASLTLGDLDGDGDWDLYVANFNQPDQILLNDGLGAFASSGQSLFNNGSFAVALGDLDGDGDLDAFVANRNGPNRIWLNDGAGNFSNSGQQLGSFYNVSAALRDLDGDGDLDAFVGKGLIGASQPAEVWVNNGMGQFTDSGQRLGNTVSFAISLGDVDGDGDVDAFVGAYNASSRIWFNDGHGVFADSGQDIGTTQVKESALGDLNCDGDLDIFLANGSGPNTIWLNDGFGRFYNSGQQLGSSDSTSVALGDVDGDGDLDAAIANFQSRETNEIWLNASTVVRPSLSISAMSVLEGHGGATGMVFTVNLNTTSTLPVSVRFTTADSTATVADDDYAPTNGVIVFAPGESIETVTVLVTGDTSIEPDEDFLVTLSNATNATLSITQAVGMILNDDAPEILTDVPAINVPWETTATAPKHNSATAGWEFSVSSPVKVTDLGLFDAGQDGFQEPHHVGIWNTNGALLLQTTFASGTGATLRDGFRYRSVPETVLRPGSYVIGAYFVHAGPDEILADPASAVTAPQISFVQPRYEAGDSFTFPNVGQGLGNGTNHFGPNFLLGTEILEPKWQSVAIPDLPSGSELRAVWARTWDEAYVWAVRFEANVPHASLFRWDGASWRQVLALANHAPGRIFGTGEADVFLSTEFYPDGLIGGTVARIYRSTDQGATWTQQTLPGEVADSDLGFGYFGGTPNNVHVHVGAGHVLRFDGTNWNLIFSETSRGIYGLTLVGENEGYYVTCGDWGSWDGANWTYRGPAGVGCDVYGGAWGMRDAAGLSLYAVGQNNFNNGVRVWGFDEASQTWSQVFADGQGGSGTGNGLGVWGSAPDDVYVVGELISGSARSGRVYRFDGASWAPMNEVGAITTPGGIAGTARDDVWVSLRHEGRMLHFTPPGAPALSIAADSTNILVSWPRAATGYRLEATDSLFIAGGVACHDQRGESPGESARSDVTPNQWKPGFPSRPSVVS